MEGSTPLCRGEDRVLSLLFPLSEAFIRNTALTTPFTAPPGLQQGGAVISPLLFAIFLSTPQVNQQLPPGPIA